MIVKTTNNGNDDGELAGGLGGWPDLRNGCLGNNVLLMKPAS